MNDLIAAVKRHARENYNRGGWDIVVECYDDADLAALIGGAKTEREAIDKVADIVGIHHERRNGARIEGGLEPYE